MIDLWMNIHYQIIKTMRKFILADFFFSSGLSFGGWAESVMIFCGTLTE